MNADFVLEAVSRFGDDAEGIGHFRKVVIGLAIAGKLAGEGQLLTPAEMLDQIESEKIRLVRDGQVSRSKRYSPVTAEQLPEVFSDPTLFVPLGALARIEKGLTGIQGAKSGSFPLVVTAAERSSCDHFDYEGPATIVPLVSSTGHGNASINRLHYQEGRFALGTILAAIFPYAPHLISARFIFEYLSTFKDELLVSRMTGTANVTLSVGKIAEVPVPLICPSIQRRADELMALCDQLEAARVSREAARDTFTASTLAKLNTPDPETFGQDVRFALASLAPLTTRPDQIKQLRQIILNLAVLGKLVEQNPADEIAEVPPLRQFSAASGIDPAVFEKFSKTITLPSGWQVAPLAQLSENIVDCPHTTPKWKEQGEICIRTNQLRPGALDLSAPRYVSPEEYTERVERMEPLADDILYSREGGILGIACRVPPGIRLCLGQRLMLIRAGAETRPDFLEMVLNSPFITSIAKACTTGGAAPRVNMSTVRAYPIPLPPVAEQHRIVAKVDELMALCDQLEASLTTGEQTRSRLLESVLHHALEPA